jgi:hypothetical protein
MGGSARQDVGLPRKAGTSKADVGSTSDASDCGRLSQEFCRLPTLAPLQDVNARCIEMLVNAARAARPDMPTLVSHLQGLLRRTTPDMRARAARGAVLMVDMQFANLQWWQMLKDHPNRLAPVPAWRGAFPRQASVQLARSALTLAWHSVRSDRHAACLLGITPPVAELIASLSVTEIDQVVERRFRHVRPRWEDRPTVWRRLLLSAEVEDLRRARDFNVYSLQLLTADLLTPPVPFKGA